MIKRILSFSVVFCMVLGLSDFAKAESKNKNQSRFGKKSFIKADTDKNGLVSEAEFVELQKQKFKEIDLNKDGSIDETERKKAVVKNKKKQKKVDTNEKQSTFDKKEEKK